MPSNLIVNNLTPQGDSQTLQINGSLSVNGSIEGDFASNLMIKPYGKILKWEVNSTNYPGLNASGVLLENINLGLEETDAKYLLASVYGCKAFV